MIVSKGDGRSCPPRLRVKGLAGTLGPPFLVFDELVPEEFGEDFGAKEFFQDVMGYFRRRMPNAVVIQQAVGGQGVDMRVEIEVFAKSVQGQEERGPTFREIEGSTEGAGDGLLRDGTQAFEQAAMTVEGRPQEFGESEDVVAVGDGKQDLVDQVGGGALDLALMT